MDGYLFEIVMCMCCPLRVQSKIGCFKLAKSALEELQYIIDLLREPESKSNLTWCSHQPDFYPLSPLA